MHGLKYLVRCLPYFAHIGKVFLRLRSFNSLEKNIGFARRASQHLEDIGGCRLRIICVGVRGDWVFLRKVIWDATCCFQHLLTTMLLQKMGGLTVLRFTSLKFRLLRCAPASNVLEYAIAVPERTGAIAILNACMFYVFSGYMHDWSCIFDIEEWENPTSSAAWCKLGPGPSPFKAGCIMTKIPGCQTPESVLLDYCHIFHLGYGCDIGASPIVLLSRLGHFGQGSFDVKLACAYERFDEWCRANSHTSHISIFSRLAFDMSWLLARTLHALRHAYI